MSRYTNMCQVYCHINSKGVQTYLTLAHFYPLPVGEGGFQSRQDSVRHHVFLWAQKLKNYSSIYFEILTSHY